MNQQLAIHVLEEILALGVEEFCVCPGARNTPFVYPLAEAKHLKIYYWFEERSAAFFALGRFKATGKPIAIVTTSGTAVAELLPAAMEAYYTGAPLIFLTADRPRRFRGSGAPQSAEQVGVFGQYVSFEQDLEKGDYCYIQEWRKQGPAHLNVCFEEPKEAECQLIRLNELAYHAIKTPQRFIVRQKSAVELLQPIGAGCSSVNSFYAEAKENAYSEFFHFLTEVRCPLVVVGALDSSQKEKVVEFLLKLNAPVYAEGISGIREDSRLTSLRIQHTEKVWDLSRSAGYSIDGILRLGGVPTARLWRDIESKQGEIHVCSISDLPFSGLSWGGLASFSLEDFLKHIPSFDPYPARLSQSWISANQSSYQKILALFGEEPQAEASLVHAFSKQIPFDSRVYLGNSLPIREWDLAAIYQGRGFIMGANRGVNGIDGQLSTFFGFSQETGSNWAILGDLTALYDLAAPWILNQLSIQAHITIINNGGGQIFSRMFSHPAMLNVHNLSFEPVAKLWGLEYHQWKEIPSHSSSCRELIEIVPNELATRRFWQQMEAIVKDER